MAEDRDVRVIESAERKLETAAGKGVTRVVLLAFGIVTTALLASINSNLSSANALAAKAQETAEKAQIANYDQDQQLALLKVRTDSIERKTDAAIDALRVLTIQVTHNGDAIEHTRGSR